MLLVVIAQRYLRHCTCYVEPIPTDYSLPSLNEQHALDGTAVGLVYSNASKQPAGRPTRCTQPEHVMVVGLGTAQIASKSIISRTTGHASPLPVRASQSHMPIVKLWLQLRLDFDSAVLSK